MMNWSGFSIFLKKFLKLTFVLLFAVVFQAEAQLKQSLHSSDSSFLSTSLRPTVSLQDTTLTNYPDPKSVLYKSLMIPGWGQVINKQWWKVPIIYGLLGGLSAYSIFLTKKYHDYRAAYYNLNEDTPDDERFGSTPSYISPNANLSSLRDNRNFFRNRRDFIYLTIGLAYGLNAIDAYIFAHLRSFNVSEDLSMRPSLKPAVLANVTPGVTLSLELFNRSN